MMIEYELVSKFLKSAPRRTESLIYDYIMCKEINQEVDEEGYVRVPMKTLIQALDMSATGLLGGIERLEEKGIIIIDRPPKPQTNGYKINREVI